MGIWNPKLFLKLTLAENKVNRKLVKTKQLKILKTFLEYLEFYIVSYRRRFCPKRCLTNYPPRDSCL